MEDHETIHVGDRLVSWEVDEYMRHTRSRRWYILSSILGAALIIFAIATSNFLFAVIILMIGVITLITTFTEPERINVIVTTTGIVVGDAYYDYQAIRDFSLAYEPPDVKHLYVDFNDLWKPLLAIPLEHVDPNSVREELLPYVIENLERTEERLTDAVRRVYKF